MMTLRKIESNDIPYLYQWENDALAWADGSNHNPLSHSDLQDYVSATTGDIFRDGQLRLIVEDEGCTIGCVDLFDFDPRNRRAAIGMYVAPPFRGQGKGKQIVAQIEEYAFGFLHLRVLYAVIAVNNVPCSALYRGAGYQPSSVLPKWTLESDAVIYIKTDPRLNTETNEG